MPDLPAHASPAPALQSWANLSHSDQQIADLQLDHHEHPPLLSPAFTPPATPGTGTPAIERDAHSVPVDTSLEPAPNLLDQLPEVNCVVRARIPTTTGQEMFLHLYQNNVDNKEHLAIVFGNQIRSKSLDAPREGETEMDRMIRGAYTGRLYPGRSHSRVEQIKNDTIGSSSSTSISTTSRTPTSSTPHSPSSPGTPVLSAQEPKAPLVRIHSECYTGETVWSARCDCGEQLDEAARLMSLPGNLSPHSLGGVIIYLRQEGRGIGLGEKLKAYNLQDLGNDTYEANVLLRHPADARSYGLATSMLVDLGLGKEGSGGRDGTGGQGIRLLTNNPDKVRAVEGPRREVIVKERVAMIPLAWKKGGRGSEEVEKYLSTKIEKFKHMLSSG
ncbi:MAG: GTP cyclohydrolase II [Bathelium mastoideum]|nr:MAG: GTP cyclohydrolase II [Bathelium mastoideum]